MINSIDSGIKLKSLLPYFLGGWEQIILSDSSHPFVGLWWMLNGKLPVKCAVCAQSRLELMLAVISIARCRIRGTLISSSFPLSSISRNQHFFLSSTAKLLLKCLKIATVWGKKNQLGNRSPFPIWLDCSQYSGRIKWYLMWRSSKPQPHPGLIHCWHVVWRLSWAVYPSLQL